MKRILIIIVFISSLSASYAQKEYWNWLFGERAGITFCTPDTVPKALLFNNMNFLNVTASISDSAGNLLFYTNGLNIYNREHDMMKEGDNIFAFVTDEIFRGEYLTHSNSFINFSVIYILKKPDSDSLYYMIYEKNNSVVGNYLAYSIVDISKDNGMGEVVEKNSIVSNHSDSFTIVKHRNDKDFWLINFKSNLEVFLINEDGISKSPLYFANFNADNWSVEIDVSKDGKKIAIGTELFSFNNCSGEIEHIVRIRPKNDFINSYLHWEHDHEKTLGLNYTPNGFVSFSLDSKKLYIIDQHWYLHREYPGADYYGWPNQEPIFQVDLSVMDRTVIENSVTAIEPIGWYGQMQLGPDGKIYVARDSSDYLGVIHNPNASGKDCNFEREGVYLGGGGRRSAWDLPQMIYDAEYNGDLYIIPEGICEGEALYLYTNLHNQCYPITYKWRGPNGFSSTDTLPIIEPLAPEDVGWYYLEAELYGVKYYDSAYVEIRPKPVCQIAASSLIACQGESVELKAEPQDEDFQYLWSTGETSAEINIDQQGEYHLEVTNQYGCKTYDTVSVEFREKFYAKITGPSGICPGERKYLQASPDDDGLVYEWSTGETTPLIWITGCGQYFVKVSTKGGGCVSSDTIEVEQYEAPKAEFEASGPLEFCSGDSVTIFIKESYKVINWSDGSRRESITIHESGNYYLAVANENLCADTAFFTVNVLESPEIEINNDGPLEFCEGESVNLSISGSYDDFHWEDGSKSENREIRESGNYWAAGTNANGCTDTAYVEVIVHDLPDVKIMPSDTVRICEEESITLKAEGVFNQTNWPDNELTVYESGVYELIAEGDFGCSDTLYAYVEIINTNLNISNIDGYDFGKVMAGEKKTEKFVIPNNSEYEIKIDEIEINNSSFNYQLNQYVSLPGEDFKLTIEFSPDDFKEYEAELTIRTSKPCDHNYLAKLKGTGVGTMEVWLPDTSATPGEKLCMPLYARLLNDTEAELSYESEVTLPIDMIEVQGSDVWSSGGQITIGRNEQVLSEICGEILLSQRDKAPFVLDLFEIDNPLIDLVIKDGSLEITGVCEQNLRKIALVQQEHFSISPNPADNEIQLKGYINETQTVSISIYNILGVELYSCNEEFQKGDIDRVIEINQYPSGVYMLTIRTESGTQSHKLLILK